MKLSKSAFLCGYFDDAATLVLYAKINLSTQFDNHLFKVTTNPKIIPPLQHKPQSFDISTPCNIHSTVIYQVMAEDAMVMNYWDFLSNINSTTPRITI